MLDTAKHFEVTLLYWMRLGGFIFCKKMAGGSLLGLGKDRIVRLARRSFVKSWRPGFLSVVPPSSPKIEVGTSTLSPVVGIVYLRHSRFDAPACNVVNTRPSKTTRANVRRKCRGEARWALINRDGPFIAKAPRRERDGRLFLRFPNCAQRPVKDRERDRESMDRDR
jgi:hypothetical protein